MQKSESRLHRLIKGEIKINWLDYSIMGFATICAANGFRIGLIRELVGVATLILGFALSLSYYPQAGSVIAQSVNLSPGVSDIVGFSLLFLSVVMVGVGIGVILNTLIKMTPFSLLDRITGAIFGGIKGLLVILLIILIFMSSGLTWSHETIVQSEISQSMLDIAPSAYQKIENYLPSRVVDAIVASDAIKYLNVDVDEVEG